MTHPTRGSTQGFELPGLTGFTFQLALHGSRMQLEAPRWGGVEHLDGAHARPATRGRPTLPPALLLPGLSGLAASPESMA